MRFVRDPPHPDANMPSLVAAVSPLPLATTPLPLRASHHYGLSRHVTSCLHETLEKTYRLLNVVASPLGHHHH